MATIENPNIKTNGNEDLFGKDTGSGLDSLKQSQKLKATTVVELVAATELCSLGVIIQGGADKDCPAHISAIRTGSLAQRSDAVVVGDRIVSIGGIRADGLKESQLVTVLKKCRNNVTLEVEYELPEADDLAPTVTKCTEVQLRRDGGSAFGITLRGGLQSNAALNRPLTVVQIRPGSSADSEGLLKVGDRIVVINGIDVTHSTLEDAVKLLRHSSDEVNITFEYSVSVIEAVENAAGPLLVEIDKPSGCQLGVEFTSSTLHGKSFVCIESIAKASIADRCGALHAGDQVLSIDDVSIETATPDEAMRLLHCNTGDQILLEILPRHQLDVLASTKTASVSDEPESTITSSSLGRHASLLSEVSQATAGSMTTQVGSAAAARMKRCPAKRCSLRRNKSNMGSLVSTGSVTLSHTHAQVCHVDTAQVTLFANNAQFGFGVDGCEFPSEGFSEPPFISYVEPGGAAERCGLIQEGDRILAINGQTIRGRSLHDIFDLVLASKDKLTMVIEFDVAESIVPSSGMYLVKLAKRGCGIGISISCPKQRKPGQPLVISDVKKGSIAHRTGTISPGDYLLAIGDVWLDGCSLDDAADILTASDNIVKLRIQKNECFASEPDPTSVITYQVELPRFSGPLGISLSGTDQQFDPIYIEELTTEGLANKTGALRVGDRILAINGNSLRGRSLFDAIQFLYSLGDSVNLKIMRPIRTGDGDADVLRHGRDPQQTHTVSLDSALESCGNFDGRAVEVRRCSSRELPRNSNTRYHKHGTNNFSTNKLSAEACRIETASSINIFCDLDAELIAHHSSSRHRPPTSGRSQRQSEDREISIERCKHPRTHSSATDVSALETLRGGLQPEQSTPSNVYHIVHDNSPVEDNNFVRGDYQHKANDTTVVDSSPILKDIHRLSSSGDDRDEMVRSMPCVGSGGVVGGGTLLPRSPSSSSCSDVSSAAERQLAEVDEQLQKIFTPAPLEMIKTTISRGSCVDGFGFSLSDGVYEKGIYIGAVKQDGPAADKLRPYDRILQVNDIAIKDMTCEGLVPLIAQSCDEINIVVCRNPLVHRAAVENHIDSSYKIETNTITTTADVLTSTTLSRQTYPTSELSAHPHRHRHQSPRHHHHHHHDHRHDNKHDYRSQQNSISRTALPHLSSLAFNHDEVKSTDC